jgi:hypothetical protein
MVDIAKAVRSINLESFPGELDKLKELSDKTEVDGIEADPSGVTIDQDKFNGVMAVRVVFNFQENAESIVESTSAPGKFHGHFDDKGAPVIDAVELDMLPFAV